MELAQHGRLRIALNLAVTASAILLVGGYAFVARDFGFGGAAVLVLTVLLALPLAVAVRLRWRWPAVRRRELVFLAVLLCAAAGGGSFVVRAWYADGLDRDHAEDMRWAEFERRFRRDPAFREVQVHKSERKNVHWASGTVETEADLARLHSLAAECGIEGRRLDGPFVQSVSLTVRGQPGG